MEDTRAILNQLQNTETPCFVCDETALLDNAKVCKKIRQESGAKILLALKGFSTYALFPTIAPYLDGTTASSLHEAKLGYDTFSKDHVHIYSPAYKKEEFPDILKYATHVSFNSIGQWTSYKNQVQNSTISPGLRLNPEHSEVNTPLYDPCSQNSRLGIIETELHNADLSGIEGLHFHTLCESQFPELERTVAIIEKKFSPLLHKVKWLNLGGGHHITDPNYDIDGLCTLLKRLRNTYNVEIILEPGEAIAYHAGYLATTVLDILNRDTPCAIIDSSASTHMPDVLEMPYRPHILDSFPENSCPYTYSIGGLTCLAGDIIGTYSFKEPLQIGQKLIFTDMAHYTMVKTTTFNGVPLPSIGIIDTNGEFQIQKTFGYHDFFSRLS